jgi:IclR family acetate operon transcriptional repressor
MLEWKHELPEGVKRPVKGPTVNSVEKTLVVLEAMAAPGSEHRLAEIAASAGIPKPTAHRILQILAERGYVLPAGDGAYSLGPGILGLAGSVLAHRDFARLARPAVRALQAQTGHTVHFAILSGNGAVYVDKVEARQPYQMASRVGMRIPLHCTAIGKAILSAMPTREAQGLLATAALDRRTPRTLCTVDEVLAELEIVRARGYAIDDEENEEGVRCVGAPVLDSLGNAVAGVSTSALAFSFPREEAEALGDVVRAAAGQISAALGVPSGDEAAA